MPEKQKFIDEIRDGVSADRLRAGGDRAVRVALQRTAASVINRGWGFHQWADEVQRPGSKLGDQARLKDGKPIGPLQLQKRLRAAWESAEQFLADRPPAWTRDQAQDAAAALADEVETYALDPDAILNDTERRILVHASHVARTNGTVTPALPRDPTAAALGITQRRVRDTLKRLVDRGLLVVTDWGRQGAATRRARCYRLPDQQARGLHTRGNRSVSQTVQVCRPTGSEGPANSCRSVGQLSGGTVSFELRITTTDPAALHRALAAVAAETGAQVEAVEAPPEHGDVIRLADHKRKASS